MEIKIESVKMTRKVDMVIRILPAYTDGAVQIYFVIFLSFISHLGLSYFCLQSWNHITNI